jgi:hypothetical protein
MLNPRWARRLLGALLIVSACAATDRRAQVDKARAELAARPGPGTSVRYAQQLHDAFGAGAYQGREADFVLRAQQGLAALAASESAAASDASVVVAWRGLLLSDLGRPDESWRELQRSLALRPTLLAARAVVPVWSKSGRTDQVGATCAQTAAALKGDDLYSLVVFCREQMNAVSEEAAMAWATAEVRAFYDQEKARRDADMDAQAQRAASQRRLEQHAVRDMEICSSQCKERAFVCTNGCGVDVECRQSCAGANSACVDACESRAYRTLGR